MPSNSNVLVDRLSRLCKPILTEWCLDQAVCNVILSVTGYPNIVLVATRLNKRLPVYVTQIPDDSSNNRRSINELGQNQCVCISSVCSDSGDTQDSSTSLQNCFGSPILARSILVSRVTSVTSSTSDQTSCKTASVNTTAVCEKQYQNIRLRIWISCANQSEIEAFRRKLPNTPLKLDEFLLGKSMISNGTFSPIGVVSGR